MNKISISILEKDQLLIDELKDMGVEISNTDIWRRALVNLHQDNVNSLGKNKIDIEHVEDDLKTEVERLRSELIGHNELKSIPSSEKVSNEQGFTYSQCGYLPQSLVNHGY